jgi:hypothetical protein
LAWIEKSAQKHATSGNGTAGWYEKWWEKYNAKGWSEKGAQKYGKLDDQDWWERWGEQYDGRGAVLKWCVYFLMTSFSLKRLSEHKCIQQIPNFVQTTVFCFWDPGQTSGQKQIQEQSGVISGKSDLTMGLALDKAKHGTTTQKVKVNKRF